MERKAEREKEESIKDFVNHFDQIRKCMAIGIEDMKDIHKEGLLMMRANMEGQDKSILIAAIEDDRLYEKVKHIFKLDKKGR